MYFAAPVHFCGDDPPTSHGRLCRPSSAWEHRADGLAAGWYRASWGCFGVCSARRYTRWREWLAKAALGVPFDDVWLDPEAFAGRPFIELLDFADDEGVIGPRTAAKLFADFDALVPAPSIRSVGLERWDLFGHLRFAFEVAAAGGMVVFSTREVPR